jgi:hypothetical protein
LTKQLEEAITAASNAITMWLDENSGYSLYIENLGFPVDREEDEIIERFRSLFSADPINQLIHYLPLGSDTFQVN